MPDTSAAATANTASANGDSAPSPPPPQQEHIAGIADRRLPPFWHEDVGLWFRQVEAIFVSNRITTEASKFNAVVGALDLAAMRQVRILLSKTPERNPYTELKAALIARNRLHPSERLRLLTGQLTLGDRKPSDLLDTMCSLGDGILPEPAILNLWIQRLPTAIQVPMAQSTLPLADVGQEADRLLAMTDASYAIAPVQPAPTTSSAGPSAGVAEIVGAVAKLLRDRPQRSTKPDDVCYYHWRFGNKAKKCQPPCTQEQKN